MAPRLLKGEGHQLVQTVKAQIQDKLRTNPQFLTKRGRKWFLYMEEGNEWMMQQSKDSSSSWDIEEMKLSEIVSAAKTQPGLYFTSRWPELGPKSSMWISSQGTGTRAHYDAFDNEFFQVEGRKRFRIFSPKEHFHLHLFPDAHPKARKSQVDSDAPDMERFPLFRHLGPPFWEGVLEPGDGLQIPAFWFHETESLDPSISVNSFQQSLIAQLANRVFESPAPGNLQSTLSLCLPSLEPTEFVGLLLKSRYAPLEIERFESEFHENDVDGSFDEKAIMRSFNALKTAHKGNLEDFEHGIREMVTAHMLEFWIAKRFGPENVEYYLHKIKE